MKDSLALLLFSSLVSRPYRVIENANDLARSVIEVNGSFVASKVLLQASILNVFSQEENPNLRVSYNYSIDMRKRIKLDADKLRPSTRKSLLWGCHSKTV